MKTIWKFGLPIEDAPLIRMPKEARPLSVQMQNGPCIWAMVEDSKPLVLHRFAVKGTGHPCDDLPEYARFIGTIQMHGGALVFHIFDLEPSNG